MANEHKANQSAWLIGLVALAAVLRILLVIRSPTPYGYVYDFYHEGIQRLYALSRLPIATDCWQCYHPPLFYLCGLPLYALGKKIGGGPGGLSDPALRYVLWLSVASAAATMYLSFRILRLYRVCGADLVVGTALILVLPCLFISTAGLEADILLTALMTAFLYYAIRFFNGTVPARARVADAVRLGAVAGLACETKYTGLLAPAIIVALAVLRIATGPGRTRLARDVGVALLVCVLVGSWKYVDNLERYQTPLFANGSAQQGFVVSDRPSFANRYDFHSLHLGDLMALTRGEVPPGMLTDLPFYGSVWTTLHGMAWSDMSFFSDPSRHGFSRHPYPAKHLNSWIASAVLALGIVPDGLAVIGLLVTGARRVMWPITVTCVLAGGVYVTWFLAQESWALKTKYFLFLLPAYVLYALLGWRWVRARVPGSGAVILATLVALIVSAHLYLLDFAWS